ncbi:hypothetical protein TOT_040000168 [Theileria orientalis strain Shintoku]|uniref:Uncharacterized protein n=1 Tax=Theileria orientalis strain Shintoku TaxID=869250 RepID=J4C493_THEOR|nr:hypothetical protein TOT_040000168 [Theileria orientalis strain Shintoku]BAM41786.1 hypothetical protein TOT_040000168 [Theileria orientalis strain Shintoku]|eukprot:XP_009692087.1 hypothetical protein TOT_040000168 [Theileria orientalis strain Shintoku]
MQSSKHNLIVNVNHALGACELRSSCLLLELPRPLPLPPCGNLFSSKLLEPDPLLPVSCALM